MKKYKYSVLAAVVEKFTGKRIMVVGDLLLDRIIRGDVTRISPEAPVPVVWVKGPYEYMPGGACNVASNLTTLGAEASLVGVAGKDAKAGILREKLREKNILTDGIVEDETRPTILKTRVFAGHNQQVLRIDRESTEAVSAPILAKLKGYIRENIRDFDGIVIEDYGKGLITPALIKEVVRLAKKHGKIVAVDPKENHFSFYKGVDVLTPNHHEAANCVGFKITDDRTLKAAGAKMLKKLGARVVLITLGEKGMMVFEKGKAPYHIPTVAQEVFDVSGAGDTVIAVYTLAIVSGCSPVLAAHISNCAAGIVVGKAGVAVAERRELLARLKELSHKGKA